MTDIIIGIFEQGLIYGIMALGIYISYKILDFPDLSADGTFPLGAAVCAALLTKGVNPWLCLPAAVVAGALAGTLTGILHVKLKIKNLLAGILTMTALYSVNYRIVGAPNAFLMGNDTIFSCLNLPSNPITPYRYLIICLVIAVIIKYLLDWYLSTKSGFLLRCVGENENLVSSLSQNPGKVKIIGLAVSNALIALSGAIACQRSMQFDISSGTGIMVTGLAAVIIGTTVFKKIKFVRTTSGVLIGMIIYKACISLAISSGMESSDTNLIISVLFIATLLLNDFLSGNKSKKGKVADNA